MLPLFALLLAVAASAFTVVKDRYSDLVWFQLDPDTGDAINPTNGTNSDTDPEGCDPNEEAPCSVALSLSKGTAVNNGGTFSIGQNVNYKDPLVYEAMHRQDRP